MSYVHDTLQSVNMKTFHFYNDMTFDMLSEHITKSGMNCKRRAIRELYMTHVPTNILKHQLKNANRYNNALVEFVYDDCVTRRRHCKIISSSDTYIKISLDSTEYICSVNNSTIRVNQHSDMLYSRVIKLL